MSTATIERKPVTRRVETLDLIYGKEVTAELPSPLKMCGIHAMKEPEDEQGKQHVRVVNPQLVYLWEAEKKTQEMTFLMVRGEGDLPLDTDKKYDFVGMTEDRKMKDSSFATVWLVTQLKT